MFTHTFPQTYATAAAAAAAQMSATRHTIPFHTIAASLYHSQGAEKPSQYPYHRTARLPQWHPEHRLAVTTRGKLCGATRPTRLSALLVDRIVDRRRARWVLTEVVRAASRVVQWPCPC